MKKLIVYVCMLFAVALSGCATTTPNTGKPVVLSEGEQLKLEVISVPAKGTPHPTPILFVPGAWHNAWCWHDFMQYFAERGYNCYAFSLRCHGESDCPEKINKAKFQDYADDLAEAVGQMPSSPILIGHSMGGGIIQKYLGTHQAPAAVLVASIPPGTALGAGWRFFLKEPGTFLWSGLTWNLYPLVDTPEKAKKLFFSKDFPLEKAAEWQSHLGNESFGTFLDLFFFDTPDASKVSGTDMLVLGAENDVPVPPAVVEKTAKAYHTEAKIFPNMAHNMMADDGWENVADSIIAWLNKKNL